MDTRAIPPIVMLEERTDRQDRADRRFYGVIIASLLLHVVAFAVFAYHEQRLSGAPPRLIMVDMATLPLPEPKAVEVTTPPEPVRPPPRPLTPAVTSPLPTASRPLAPPAVNTPPVPVAAIGETTGATSAPAKTDMTVPVAPPVARKPVDYAPSASATSVPVKAPPADGAEKLAKARASYRAQIAALIDANKEYPLFSRKAGQQGTCNVRCTMMCDGTIKRVELVKSSGFEALDKAGLRAVSNVGKFPPPPHEGACSEVSFDVPITFRLG